ncbi:hypothetical protein DFH09DRAFT_1086683 [Mycena vulgaris]|nr:hypothetical protein DFH09DRAFT_1086683 [Mycena vulgaris]
MTDRSKPLPPPALPSVFTKRRRVIVACTNCRGRKVRCLTSEDPPQSPCQRCAKKGLACEYVTVTSQRNESLSRNPTPEPAPNVPLHYMPYGQFALPADHQPHTPLGSRQGYSRSPHITPNPLPPNPQYLYPQYPDQSIGNSYSASSGHPPRRHSSATSPGPMQSTLPVHPARMHNGESLPGRATDPKYLDRQSASSPYASAPQARCGVCQPGYYCTCNWKY